jgi:SAM-dependent methyltransferase
MASIEKDLSRRIAESEPVSGNNHSVLIKRFDIPEDVSGLKIIDLGSGFSDLTSYFRSMGAEAYGLDIGYDDVGRLIDRCLKFTSSGLPSIGDIAAAAFNTGVADEFIHLYEQHPDWYIPAAMDQIPFADDTFDLTLSSFSMFGVLDKNLDVLRASLKEALRVTKKGGIVQVLPAFGFVEASSEAYINQMRAVEELRGFVEIDSKPITSYDGRAYGLITLTKK